MTEKELLASLSAKANEVNNGLQNSEPEQQIASTDDFNAVEDSALLRENIGEMNTIASDDSIDSTNDDIDENSSEKSLPLPRQSSEIAEQEEEDNSLNEDEAEEIEEEPMTLLDHLKELRRRLTRVVLVILVGFFACYPLSELAYNYLSLPLQINLPEGSSLIYTSPAGAFFVYLKISLVLSFFLSSPFSFYQVWAFVAPGLYKEEKLVLMPLAFFSAFFFLSGAAFCYFLVFPIAFEFFMGFATDTIIPMISIEEYLSFVLKLLLAFGLVFEMPLFAFFLARMGLITVERMRKWRKYAILMMFILAAILTPPDVFSQTLMALPMMVLYEISVLIVATIEKKKIKEKAQNEAEENNAEQSEAEQNDA